MTCKHNWNFLDGLVKRIRCTRCEDTKFVNKMDEYLVASPQGKYTLADTRLNNIVFYDTSKGAQREVMRISPEGVTSNPEIPVDEGAQALIRALDMYVKAMVQKEYERGVIDGKATQEPVSWGVDWGKAGDVPCVSIIKRKVGGSIEVVAVEYAPYTVKEKK